MRGFWCLMLLALALTLGCGDAHSVRTRTTVNNGSVQDQLDGVAKNLITNPLGGSP